MTDPLTIEVLRGGLVESRHQAHAVIADANGQVLDASGGRGLGQIVGPIVAGYGFDLTGSFPVSSLVAAAGLCIGAALTVVVGRI